MSATDGPAHLLSIKVMRLSVGRQISRNNGPVHEVDILKATRFGFNMAAILFQFSVSFCKLRCTYINQGLQPKSILRLTPLPPSFHYRVIHRYLGTRRRYATLRVPRKS